VFSTFLAVLLQGLFREQKPKPVITVPKKNESTCQTPQGVDEESMGNRIPVITVPKKPESTSQTPQGVDEVSMGNRIAPGYLILLSSLFCLAVVIR